LAPNSTIWKDSLFSGKSWGLPLASHVAAMLALSTALNIRIMKHLLIVAHAPSPNTLKLREAAARGAGHEDIENVCVTVKAPLEAGPEDVRACDAILLGTTENLGYMSGALKDFFSLYELNIGFSLP